MIAYYLLIVVILGIIFIQWIRHWMKLHLKYFKEDPTNHDDSFWPWFRGQLFDEKVYVDEDEREI